MFKGYPTSYTAVSGHLACTQVPEGVGMCKHNNVTTGGSQCYFLKQILTSVVFFLSFFFILERLAMAGGTHPLLHDVNIYVAQDCTGLFLMENLLSKKLLKIVNELLIRLIN